MELLGYVASILVGLSMGMIGGGGSILIVPILVYLFKTDPVQATAYSLFIVGITAMVGGIRYYRRGQVDLKTGFLFALPGFLGVYLTRAFVIPNLPDIIFNQGPFTLTKPILIMLVFAFLMVVASASMISKNKNVVEKKSQQSFRKTLLTGLQGFATGSVSGFVGAGGGFLIIPALVVLMGMPMKAAVGTSLFIIAANSLFGFLGDLQNQTITYWPMLLIITVIAIAGLFIGMSFSKSVPEKNLKKSFGYFVLFMGVFILIDQIRSLN